MKTDTDTLIKTIRILAQDIDSEDGVANSAIDEAADRLEELQWDLAQAISERTPHDYGLLAEQRDDYRRRLVIALEETEEARAEVERLRASVANQMEINFRALAKTKTSARPEPSRLEIAAQVLASRSMSAFFREPKTEATHALEAADALIAAAKEGAK